MDPTGRSYIFTELRSALIAKVDYVLLFYYCNAGHHCHISSIVSRMGRLMYRFFRSGISRSYLVYILLAPCPPFSLLAFLFIHLCFFQGRVDWYGTFTPVHSLIYRAVTIVHITVVDHNNLRDLSSGWVFDNSSLRCLLLEIHYCIPYHIICFIH